MKRDILILDNFQNKPGKLFFSRYENGNPAFFFIDDENVLLEFSVDMVNFYHEYPFGEYRLVILRNKKLAETLCELGVVNEPVFSIENGNSSFPVCELSDQVVDLLKEEGRFYV